MPVTGTAKPRRRANSPPLVIGRITGSLVASLNSTGDTIYEPRDARLWIFARQRLLEDRVPAERIQQGKVDEVLAVVNELRDGVFI